jgi:hypothetical protein
VYFIDDCILILVYRLTFHIYPHGIIKAYRSLSSNDTIILNDVPGRLPNITKGWYHAERNSLFVLDDKGRLLEISLNGNITGDASSSSREVSDSSSETSDYSGSFPRESYIPVVSSTEYSSSYSESNGDNTGSFPSFPGVSSSNSNFASASLPLEEPTHSVPVDVSDSIPTEILFVDVFINITVDPCTSITATARLDRSDTSLALYTWKLFHVAATEELMISVTQYSNQVSLALSEYEPGYYRVYVEVQIVAGRTEIRGNTTTNNIERLDDAFGVNCHYQIVYETSFGSKVPKRGEQTVVSRNRKLWIKPKPSVAAGLTYLWTVTSTSRRSLSSSTSMMTTSPDANALGLEFTVGDINISVQMQVFLNGVLAFTKSMMCISSPERPIAIPSNTERGLMIISDVKKSAKYDGVALSTKFTFSATEWVPRYNQEEFVYIFSYKDQKVNRHVPLATIAGGNVTTTLPMGYGQKKQLEIMLTVQNQWGDSNSVFRYLTVVSLSLQEDTHAVSSLTEKLVSENTNSTEFITGAITVATYINQNVNRISGSTKVIFQNIISQLLEHTAGTLFSYDNLVSMNETDLQQQIALIDVLTKSPAMLSDSSKIKALDIMCGVITFRTANTTSESLATRSTFTDIAHVVSNIIGGGFTSEQVSNYTILTANQLARELLSKQVLVTEAALSIVSDNFELVVKSDASQSMSGSIIVVNNTETGSASEVQIPDSFSADTESGSDTIVSYTMLVFKNNPYLYAQQSAQRTIASSVLDLTFHYENGSAIQVTNLTVPLQLRINKPKRSCSFMGEQATFQCKYWNEQEQLWKSDGCYWVPDNNTAVDSMVSCYCNHTTSFSAFILTRGTCPVKTPGISITGIAFNTIYVALCVPILVCLFISRNVQPARSRFIAPYVGILAILVDSVLQGWIKNSLNLAEEWSGADIVSYIIMVVANPLTVAALFIFLWQQVRFVLMQNIYYLMGSSDRLQKRIILLCRFVTSKITFSIVTGSIGGFVMLYFLALVIVASTRSTGKQTETIITAMVLSFAAYILIIALGIVSILFIDVIMSFRRSREATVATDENGPSEQYSQRKGVALIINKITSDPLKFRFEAILILVAVLIMFILYPIGIASVVKHSEAKSGLSIVRLCIELILIFTKIAAFGGYVCVLSMKAYIANRFSHAPTDGIVDVSQDDAIQLMLQEKEGYKLFERYCREEFSLENLYLYTELEQLRSNNLIMTEQERKQSLIHLNEIYMKRNAEREFNCSNSVKRKFAELLSQELPNAAGTEGVYAQIHGACLTNLADTFTRLINTQEYEQYSKGKILEKELNTI